MANDVDNDRISATTKGGNVVDLDAYRARAKAFINTSQKYVDPATMTMIFFVAAIFIFLAFMSRR